jgi:hypothetical protein
MYKASEIRKYRKDQKVKGRLMYKARSESTGRTRRLKVGSCTRRDHKVQEGPEG